MPGQSSGEPITLESLFSVSQQLREALRCLQGPQPEMDKKGSEWKYLEVHEKKSGLQA